MKPLRFSTSGWRGILGDEFTHDRVRALTVAIAEHLRANGDAERGVVIGYDTRFMGADFARFTANTLASAGIRSFLCTQDCPTPAIVHAQLQRQAAGAFNFTASHNPHMYNGIKYYSDWGGQALPNEMDPIVARANAALVAAERSHPTAAVEGRIERIDPRDDYLDHLQSLIDLPAIAASGLGVAINSLYGTSRHYLAGILENAGVPVTAVHQQIDPYFGGLPPDPIPKNMADFVELVQATAQLDLGLATDGDADRYGIVDRDGTYVEPNYILALLYDYLIRRKGRTGGVARSAASSHLIDAVAHHHGMEVYETPVGFKWIGDHIVHGRILIGGEESAGLSVAGHLPEKDGILACLLVAEMVAVEGVSLKELLHDLYARVGRFYSRRQDLQLTPSLQRSIRQHLDDPPTTLAGRKVVERVNTEGCKLILEDGSWVLFRHSSTEPVVRICAEAASEDALRAVMKGATHLILN